MISFFLKKRMSPKLVLSLAVFYAIAFLIRFFKIAYQKTTNIQFLHYTWEELFIDYFYTDYITIIIFTLIVIYSSDLMIKKNLPWLKIIFIHLSINVFIGFTIYYISTIFFIFLRLCPISDLNPIIYINKIINNIDFIFLMNLGMMLIVYFYFYSKKAKENEIEKKNLESQLMLAKLNLIKSNLQPHFLFNTLNSISSLIYIDKKIAQNTLADLSDLLRILLRVKDENLITLKQELFMLSKYNNIMKVRFSDNFYFKKDINPGLENCKIPSFILQPIIENSIKYGYSQNHVNLNINLTVRKINNHLSITICNNGKALDKKYSKIKKGFGINSTVERLETLFNNNFSFKMYNKKNDSGVITTIIIPYITPKRIERSIKQTYKS